MKYAVMIDECGCEVVEQFPDNATADDVADAFPEYRFRYWETDTPRERAERPDPYYEWER